MYKPIFLISVMASSVTAQTIERRVVDIVYGDKVIRSTHQVVLDTELEVGVIPAEETKPEIANNMVITASDNQLSYLDQSKEAFREQAIYDEVNRRTRESPYTVLFTGHIPDDIQKKRLEMMPEVGLFGDDRDKLLENQGDITQEIGLPSDPSDIPDAGEFSTMDQPTEQSARNALENAIDADLNRFISGEDMGEITDEEVMMTPDEPSLESFIKGTTDPAPSDVEIDSATIDESVDQSTNDLLEKLIGG